MNKIKLNNGIEIPLIGIGTNTFGKEGNLYHGEINFDIKELEYAITNGYRLIDTAISYRNEAVIGKAITNANIPRKDFIITTKIPGGKGYLSNDEIDKAINDSLKNLNTNYIDIVLMHHPWDNNLEMIKVYNYLETYVNKGIIKSLGVSNFNEEQLSLIIENSKIKPSLNQIASYPGNFQHKLINFSQKNSVAVQAWSPLNRTSDEAKDILNKIGEKYNKTWAQVLLNYQVSRDVIVLPKSHRFEGQKENFDIFDFKLTKEEKEIVSKL